MIFYIAIILISTALALATELVEKKTNKKYLVWILIACTILFPAIIGGLRYGVGTDELYVYKPMFESIKKGIYENRFRTIEIGYVLINKLVILINGDFNLVMFITSLITIACTYFGIRNYKDKVSTTLAWFFFLILFYQRSFNLVRQMMSLSIIFYGFKYLNIRDREKNEEKKKYAIYYMIQTLKYLACVFIAFLFHKTSLIMLVAIFLRPIYSNSKYKYISLATFVALLAIILNFKHLYNITKEIPMLERYSTYFINFGKSHLNPAYFIKIVMPVIVPYFFMIKNVNQDKKMSLIFCFSVLGCVAYLLGYLTDNYGERIAYYFQISEIILFPFYIKCFYENFKTKKYIYIPAITIFMMLNIGIWYNDYIRKQMNATLPYRTVFQRDIVDEERKSLKN